MPAQESKPNDISERANAIFEEKIKPNLSNVNEEWYVIIDVNSDDYEVDEDDVKAYFCLRERRRDGDFFLRKVGFPYVAKWRPRMKCLDL